MNMKNNNLKLQLELIKTDTVLSQEEKDIIVGTTLGDGHINSKNKFLGENFTCNLS
jgi:hypothetical protein